MVNFPSTLDTSTTLPAESASTPLSTNHVTAHQNIQDALEALEAKVGVNSSAVTTSHDYKLSGVTGTDLAVSKTGTETLTNKTLTTPVITSPTLNMGSDAEGDTYYRNSSGALVRLARGTDNHIYKMNGNVPNWEAEASIANASSTVAGLVEIATAAEITAGTATGGTGAILAISPDQLALATPVFDGSGLTNVNGTRWKTGQVTQNINSGTTLVIAHGLGVAPKFIKITVQGTQASGGPGAGLIFSVGTYNGTTQNCNFVAYDSNGGPLYAANQDTTHIVHLGVSAAGSANSAFQAGTASFDATNITITFSTTGSPSSVVANYIWEAIG